MQNEQTDQKKYSLILMSSVIATFILASLLSGLSVYFLNSNSEQNRVDKLTDSNTELEAEVNQLKEQLAIENDDVSDNISNDWKYYQSSKNGIQFTYPSRLGELFEYEFEIIEDIVEQGNDLYRFGFEGDEVINDNFTLIGGIAQDVRTTDFSPINSTGFRYGDDDLIEIGFGVNGYIEMSELDYRTIEQRDNFILIESLSGDNQYIPNGGLAAIINTGNGLYSSVGIVSSDLSLEDLTRIVESVSAYWQE